jgi:predicted MFS family arabinose efflux permease
MSKSSNDEFSSSKKLFLFGLLFAVFSTNVIDVLAPLLYPEIAQTFGIEIGTAVQLSAFSAIAGVITGFALSAFSIRIRYKTLLMIGVSCIIFCALGVFLAPTFMYARIFYALNGVGSVIVGVMTATLIGEIYPLEKKARRISWVAATTQIALLIGYPITGYISNTAEAASGWRNTLLWFMFPIAAISLLLVYLLVPSKPLPNNRLNGKEHIIGGFKSVVTNRSALACLVGALTAGAFFSINTFSSSFLKYTFNLLPLDRSIVALSGLLFLTVGLFLGGLLVNKIGRKRLTIAASIPAFSLSIVGYFLATYTQNIWIFLVFQWIAGLIGGTSIVSGTSLALEQVPIFRGTMMSLNTAMMGTGGAIGVLAGGFIINNFGNSIISYPIFVSVVSTLGIVGSIILYFFGRDPCS